MIPETILSLQSLEEYAKVGKTNIGVFELKDVEAATQRLKENGGSERWTLRFNRMLGSKTIGTVFLLPNNQEAIAVINSVYVDRIVRKHRWLFSRKDRVSELVSELSTKPALRKNHLIDFVIRSMRNHMLANHLKLEKDNNFKNDAVLAAIIAANLTERTPEGSWVKMPEAKHKQYTNAQALEAIRVMFPLFTEVLFGGEKPDAEQKEPKRAANGNKPKRRKLNRVKVAETDVVNLAEPAEATAEVTAEESPAEQA